jgi:thymidylate synthase ThyX
MGFSVRILADSVAPCGKRLTTWELTYPRFIHSELMTHRLFSRNAASSRAIPTKKLLQQVMDDPVVPLHWGRNQSGMQAREELDPVNRSHAFKVWMEARDQAVMAAEAMAALGVHKQVVNRVLEPFMFITVIVSATEFDNFFHLRRHQDAQPEIAWVAEQMWVRYSYRKPKQLEAGEWHLPLIFPQDGRDLETLQKISVGRCARVSYLTHDGQRDPAADAALHDRLAESGHWSPFEHVAMALEEPTRYGNFIGWWQYRKRFSREAGPTHD